MLSNEYTVVDLGAVAYLLLKGFRHTGLKPTGKNGQLSFVFDSSARSAADDYFMGAAVPARQFADCLRVAKSILYDRKEIYHKDHADFAANGGAR